MKIAMNNYTPKVSVIVPVYNVAEYIRRCVGSIIKQTYKNIEVILVDDGSTDGSEEICDRYANEDERIFVIHKENGGLSSARNKGLDCCVGEYIYFCDSDDYIALDAIECLVKTAINNDCDVVACDYYVDIDGEIINKKTGNSSGVFTEKSKIIEHIALARHGGPAVWTKLFKRDVLENIRFDNGKLYEDAFFMLKWIKNTKRMGVVNKSLYYYFRRRDSITLSQFSLRDYDHIEAWKHNLEIVEREYPDCVEVITYRLLATYRKILERVAFSDFSGEYKAEKKNFIWKNVKFLPKLMLNKYSNIKDVIAVILLCTNPKIYNHVKKTYQR